MKNLLKALGVLGAIGLFGVFPVVAQAATISFSPSSGTLNKGCEVTIDVNLDTQGVQTDGTDAIILYNPAQLSTSTAQITNGTIYPEFPGNSVDQAGGKIGMSGVSAVASPFSGTGVFAKIKFRVSDTLTAGTPISLKFDFDPNNKTKTVDTNVVERGTIADVLSSVTDGNYTVGTGNCAQGVLTSTGGGSRLGPQGQALTGQSGTGTQSAQYQVYKPNLNDVTGGAAGLLDNTLAVSAVGILLVILGVAGLAML